MNYKILLVALGAIFFQLVSTPAFAIKAYKGAITVTQPDGSTLSVRLHGDEFHHYQTTEDGYLLKANAKGYLTYATVNAAGETVESEFTARNVAQRTASEIQFLKTAPATEAVTKIQSAPRRSKMLAANAKPQKAYPLNGSPKALVILVNFTDKSFVTPNPQTAYTNLLNQDGYSANGGTGSARDYFMASTYGKFSPNFVVVGPYTLSHNIAYYGTNVDGIDGNDQNPRQMIIDACTLASQNGVNFADYDTDNDGYVDNVFVYYAGYNEAEGAAANTIWPHRWSLANETTRPNGKIVWDYSCTSELKGTSGANMCGIGTFCHEFGHVLGLPDYYHTTADKNTVNEWDIMDYGAYLNSGCTPPTYSVYDRFYLGYLTPEQISTSSDLTLLPIYQGNTQPANTNNQSYLFSGTTHNLSGSNPNPSEFFMVEYRKKTGWDTYLPAEGMLIWHIDYDATAWNNNEPNNYTGTTQTASSHMRVYLQPLSGSTTTPGTAFTTGSFIPTTWSGTDINRAISNITKTATNVTFRLTASVPTISTSGTVNAFNTRVNTPSAIQSINVTGAGLNANVVLSLQNQNNFEIKLSTATTWSKTVTLAPTAQAVNANIQIRYNPAIVGNHTNSLILTSTGAETVNVALTGTAVDPTSPKIVVGNVDGTLAFARTVLNATSSKVLNIKTTDINGDLSFVLSGANAGFFTVSAQSMTKDNANAFAGTNITVGYHPTEAGQHSATLTISGGGLPSDKVIILSGEGY